MSEPQFDIDKAGDKFEDAKAQRLAELEENDQQDELDNPDDKRPDPHTYMTHQQWIDAGRDPEDYIGKKAFQKRYDDIQDSKRLRRDFKNIQKTQQQTVDAVERMLEQEHEKARAEIEAEISSAEENEDVRSAIDAQKRLDKHNAQVPVASTPPGEHPVIQDFREANPIIDAGSEDFDPEFNADVEAIYYARWNPLTQGGKVKLSDTGIKRILDNAIRAANVLHKIEDPAPIEDLPSESPRNKRNQTSQRATRRAKQSADIPRAEDFKIENPKNGRDKDAGSVRDMIRETAVKNARKAGKNEEDSIKAGKEAAADFEKSIAREIRP